MGSALPAPRRRRSRRLSEGLLRRSSRMLCGCLRLRCYLMSVVVVAVLLVGCFGSDDIVVDFVAVGLVYLVLFC